VVPPAFANTGTDIPQFLQVRYQAWRICMRFVKRSPLSASARLDRTGDLTLISPAPNRALP
jgi:hypothetical protein